jgi:membrane-associated protein
LIAVAVNQPIVHSVHEARPYTALPHILVLADRSTDPSFPSDHATMAGAVAVGLWFVSHRLSVVAAVAAVLMAFTRVYIGAHYPADVAAGLLLGGIVAGLVWLLGLHGVAVYALVGLIVFAEDALFVGFVLPGETVAVLGGVAASAGRASLPVMIAVVVSFAIIGDSVGYEVGRHVGPRILDSRFLQRRRDRIDRAREQLARRGGAAVFFGRFVAFLRATMPALAGTAGMRYPKFLAFNAAGGLAWGITVVLIGYLAGNSYARIEHTFGRATALLAFAVLLVAATIWHFRRRRSTGR